MDSYLIMSLVCILLVWYCLYQGLDTKMHKGSFILLQLVTLHVVTPAQHRESYGACSISFASGG
jgi:hypothetical protein